LKAAYLFPARSFGGVKRNMLEPIAVVQILTVQQLCEGVDALLLEVVFDDDELIVRRHLDRLPSM
jgi:hypothetical protein